MVLTQGTKQGTTITLVNYDLYQGEGITQGTTEGITQGTTEGQQTKKKQPKETKKKNPYADFVTLTLEEYEKLTDKYGKAGTDEMIEVLNNYKASSGKRYKSDFHTILGWVKDRWLERRAGFGGSKPPEKSFGRSILQKIARGEKYHDKGADSQVVDIAGHRILENE